MNTLSDEKFLGVVAHVCSCALPHQDAVELVAEIGRRLSAATIAANSAHAAVQKAEQAEAAAVGALTAALSPMVLTLSQVLERARVSQPFPLLKQ